MIRARSPLVLCVGKKVGDLFEYALDPFFFSFSCSVEDDPGNVSEAA